MKFSAAIAFLFVAREGATAFAPRASVPTAASTARLSSSSVAEPSTDTEATAAVQKELSSLEKEIEGMRAVQEEEMKQVAVEAKEEKAEVFVPPPGAPSISDWDRIEPGRYADKRDYGFDPLGLSEQFDLYTMMEAEIRHARLAMLAVIGWPLSELIAPDWMLQGQNHLCPSVLNGFNPLTFLTTVAVFGALGFAEYKTSLRINSVGTELGQKHKSDMQDVWKYGVPGDYNFDPLGLYNSFGDSAVGRKAMRELEISHGRWAMMAITAFAGWEALTGHAVVENTMFFEPNLTLPALAAAYLSFGFFFEVENTDQYLFQIRTTSEGQMRMQRIQNGLGYIAEDAKKFAPLIEDGIEGAKNLMNKYDNFVEDYTESKMSYTDKQ